jgi:hypothetical protein
VRSEQRCLPPSPATVLTSYESNVLPHGPVVAGSSVHCRFLIVPGMFAAEAALIHEAAKTDSRATGINAAGVKSKLWFPADHQAHDVYTAICHCSRMVDTLELLMDDEVWLYHKKVVTKDAESYQPEPEGTIGGSSSNAWAWHQDYGVSDPCANFGSLGHRLGTKTSRDLLPVLVFRPGSPHTRADLLFGGNRQLH